MDLTTITMDPEAASKAFLEYRASVRQRHNAEEEQIMRGYRALADGQRVIDLTTMIRKGGGHTQSARWGARNAWVPNLAVMRADAPWCHVRTRADGSVTFYKDDRGPRSNETRYVVSLPAGTLPPPDATPFSEAYFSHFRAMVPPVPPGLRPADSLGNYHVLFEAVWQDIAPKDPALLKHIGGNLYVVCATWDLTELERTVLAGRFR
jgi:hypothetical protein